MEAVPVDVEEPSQHQPPKESSGEAAAFKPSEKLASFPVTVPEPSKSRVRDGTIHPFGMGRSRSRSNSVKSLFFKDTWSKAELYLTETTLCYKIQGVGVLA